MDIRAGTTNSLEIRVKRAMIAAGHTCMVVADSSEFGRRALARVAGLDDVDAVITDAGLTEGVARPFGAELVRADPP